jgi:hypothetical protein
MDGSTPRPAKYNEVYGVDDLRKYVEPPLDLWADYLHVRYAKREALYNRLEPSDQEQLCQEVRRVRYFRNHFKDYRISPKDRLPLVALLEDSRVKWRDHAHKRVNDELAKVQREIDRNGETDRRVRNRAILRMVQRWRDKDYAVWQNDIAPDSYMDLETGPGPDSSEDNPREPNYGYNGWLIAWEEGEGGVSMNHPLVHGSFPHQKISMQQLLYNKADTPLKRDTESNQLRYFHLPANSMKWVEDAISRYYGEDNVEFDGRRVLNNRSNAQRLLRYDLWRGHQRGGAHLPAHSRQMGARCASLPSVPTTTSGAKSKKRSGRDIALFMPFLHWEMDKRLQRMNQFVQVAKSRNEHAERLRRASTSRIKGRMVDIARLESLDPGRPETAHKDSKSGTSWRPQSAIAKYIWYVAKLYQIIDEAADGRLIEDHLFADPPLHMRRTLEQYYYWTATDTTRRDSDQVVCRLTRSQTEDAESTARLIMVDQLWLWILDDNTVISSFPRRWGRNKPDPSAVHRGIRDRLGELGKDQINSVYDMAFIIIDECSKVFFDRTTPLDHRPEVVDLFSSAISNIAEKKTSAYEDFGNAVSKMTLDRSQIAEKMMRRSLNIGFEWATLVEAQQVIDELQILQGIFAQQISVMADLEKDLGFVNWKAIASRQTESAEDAEEQATLTEHKARDRLSGLAADMQQRRDELKSMEELQTKTRTQLRELLDMKQQQANIIEAKAAIARADESVLQGRSIVVFTVVTIFFLPLSFMTSVFGMNTKEFSEDGSLNLDMTLRWMRM